MSLASKIPLIGAALAVLACFSLFIIDLFHSASAALHAALEALALILIGASFMSLCFTVCRGQDRYHWRMMIGITFCLWGIEAVMPPGLPRLLLADLVILLFVLDLVLIILERSLPILKKE